MEAATTCGDNIRLAAVAKNRNLRGGLEVSAQVDHFLPKIGVSRYQHAAISCRSVFSRHILSRTYAARSGVGARD